MPNFPNLFCVYGPGTNLASGASLFYHSEFQVHYAMEAIRETIAAGARWTEVLPDAHEEYVGRYRDEIGQLVWSHPSIRHSHYKNPRRQGLHAVALAARPVLGVDPEHRPGALRLRHGRERRLID